MKKLLAGTLLLASSLVFALPAMAQVNVGINISLPPLIAFSGPPQVVVIPETYVYVVPDVEADIFFYNGWWWRPWEGRWYRSRHYNSGWVYYKRVPSFYRNIPSSWRNDYRARRWGGQQWNYQRIPHQQVQRNWRTWEKNRYWEKKQTWGVQGLRPRTQSREVQPQHYRPQSQTVTPQSREVIKPQQYRPQTQRVQPQQIRPQYQTVTPQSREIKPRQLQPQHQGAPQQSGPQHGKPEKGGGDKHGGGDNQGRK